MANKPLFMESTTIEPIQTAGEIMLLLVRSGAREISQMYDASGQPVGLKFIIEAMPGIYRCFVLPVRTEPIFKLLQKRRNYPFDYAAKDRSQSKRVAWRQLYRWVQAQLAMIEVGMVSATEVYLPYMQSPDGQTVFELYQESFQKQLPEKAS